MSKQKKIREGMWGIIDERLFNHLITEEEAMLTLDELLHYLHSQDVVIKVDVDYGGMEKIVFGIQGSEDKKKIYSVSINNIKCVAVEPLIEMGFPAIKESILNDETDLRPSIEKALGFEPLIKEEGLDEADWAALGNL